MTITIKDIARELGYSISTVSRALQNHPDISAETKARVTAYAREHHYRPNQLATSLRTQKNTTIGVLLPDITNYFYSSLLAGVEKAAMAAGYTVLMCRTNEDPERERQNLQMLHGARVAGIIACPTNVTTDYSPYSDLVNWNVPLVLCHRMSPVPCTHIVSDDFGGAYRMVEYLIMTGCKHIALFTATTHVSTNKERERGWREALVHYGMTPSDDLIHYCNTRDEAVLEASKLFGQSSLPDACFCINDRLADGVIYVARMHGVQIPSDMSVGAFSAGLVVASSDLMLSSAQVHGFSMGEESFRALLAEMESSSSVERAKTATVLPVDLVIRETTK